jgi:flagellar hook assembly protein FlgD
MQVPFQVSNAGKAHLKVYNVAGELVKVLAEADFVNGSYLAVWDGKNERGDVVSSGLYLILYESPGGVLRQLVGVVK